MAARRAARVHRPPRARSSTRDQVEILGGGYYEPVLASLPERDRIGQLRRMGDELEALFGRRPSGAWLAERVWEPDLPTSLVAAGYDWTILDDAHFRAAAIPEEDLWGPYTTEDQGQLLRVFGTEQGLRYRIPFRDVDEVIDYLREHATEDGERVGMMGDDGEKFGAWPTTWEHCWGERRWVDRFFEALEANADWLTTTTPSAWLADHAPDRARLRPDRLVRRDGRMGAAARGEPAPSRRPSTRAVAEHAPEARWLRGAFWRNFQVRYREINDLHKQMLRTSAKVDAMPDGDDADARPRPPLPGPVERLLLARPVRRDLHRPHAAGDARAPDRRRGPRRRRAPARLHAAERRDLDLDGHDEVRLAGPGQVVTIDLDEGAGIGGWDIRAVRHALGAVMRRRPEAYHETLREHDAAGREPGAAPATADAPTSIHEIVLVKEPGLAERLHYDPYERRSGLVRFLPPGDDRGGLGDRRGRRARRRRRGRVRDRDARRRTGSSSTRDGDGVIEPRRRRRRSG